MNLPLNVAYVSHNSHLRMGGQRSMVLLIEHLDRTKVRPLAICPAPGELSEKLAGLDCPVVHVPLQRIKPRTLGKVLAASRQIRRLVGERQIHIISPDAARDALTCGIAKLGTRTRMVWHVRLTSRDNLDVITQYLADAMIGDSDDCRRRFSRSRRVSRKYQTIVGGVDTRVFRPAADRRQVRHLLSLPDDRCILLFVGQIKLGKGVFDIVDAMPILRRQLPPERMPLLVMIGTPDPPGMTDELRRRAEAGAVGAYVRILPQQTNIHAWMQAADVLVSASHQDTEGMSRVLYEAMACGAVPVATDIRGNRDALTADTGVLVPEQSPAEIAGAVGALMDDPDRRAAFGAQGARRAHEVFDIRLHARGVEQVYFRTLGL